MTKDKEKWRRLNTMLEAALALSRDERDRYIAHECRGDELLQAELLELIALDDDKTGGLRSAIDASVKQAIAPQSAGQPQTLSKGDRIGQFEIQRLLGSGGMGEVYEALQLEPVKRTVAIKVIRNGSQDPSVMARFESERQTLALMSHPAIATVHDAGYAPDGRPYFAMELVDGITIDDYLRENHLSLEETLELLISVCRGVQHAHQRGVIHRDLKPSNILVIEQDGSPTPKLIDFGIAKAGSTVEADLTQAGQLMGTLRYMSPEQADSMGLDVDTRSDVYAIGTIFYEILTGTHPLNIEVLSSASIVERQREFQESEPKAPSRVTDKKSPTARTAAELEGDLDWILLKALRKDREQRYGSVGELARDLECHLNNEPVEAGPPTARYRWRKFYRRNRIGVLAAGAVTASIVLGIALGTVGFIRALAAEQEALEQAATAGEVSQFLVGLFEASDPNKGGSGDITARELLDRGAQELDGRLDAQPKTKAQLLQTLGSVYEILGLLNDSFDKRLEASHLLARLDDADPLQYASVLTDLSVGYRRRGELQDAHDTALSALSLLREAGVGDGIAESYALNALGVAKITLGKYAEAEPLMQESVQVASQAAPGSAAHATSVYNLAGLYNFLGRFSEAIPLVQQAIDIWLEIDPSAPRIGDMFDGIGILQLELGQYDAAENSLQKGLEARRGSFGDDHYLVGLSLQNLGELSYTRGNPAEARARLAESIAISQRAEGDVEWRHLADQYELLAISSAQVDRFEDAYDAVTKAKALRAEFTPDDHPDAVLAEHAEAMVMLEDGRFDEAIARLQRVLAYRQNGTSDAGLDLHEALVRAYVLAGQYPLADELCRSVAEEFDLQALAHHRFVGSLVERCADLRQRL
jgi:serine/threonine protein kinase/tetratricopeptide (TPR) repeat protein